MFIHIPVVNKNPNSKNNANKRVCINVIYKYKFVPKAPSWKFYSQSTWSLPAHLGH